MNPSIASPSRKRAIPALAAPRRVLLWLAWISFAATAPAGATTLRELMQDTPAPREFVYKTVAGRGLRLFLFPAAGAKPGEARPAVACIHGGAWLAGEPKIFFPHARYFASRGAVGISIEYRLLKADGPSVADCLTDCKSALRWLRSHAAEAGIDGKRIAVLGDSAGGHLAAALGTIDGFDDPADDIPVSADAVVACNPIVDMTEPAWIKFVIAGKALDRKPPPEALQPTAAQQATARRLSPLLHVRSGQAPTLVMHGLDDHVVAPDQSRAFATAMKKAGNRCDLLLIDGARHAFIVPNYTAPEKTVVDAIRAADAFLASLGWFSGQPALTVSTPPAWLTKTRQP